MASPRLRAHPCNTVTRYDKTSRNFLAAIYLAASVIWLNQGQALVKLPLSYLFPYSTADEYDVILKQEPPLKSLQISVQEL